MSALCVANLLAHRQNDISTSRFPAHSSVILALITIRLWENLLAFSPRYYVLLFVSYAFYVGTG